MSNYPSTALNFQYKEVNGLRIVMRGGAQILDLPLDILEKLFEKNVIKAGLVRDIDVGERNERDLNLDGLMLFEEHNESVLACQFRDDECCILRANI